MSISDFVTSTQGLLAATGAACAGMAALIHEIIKLLKWWWGHKGKATKGKAKPGAPASFGVSRASILVFVLSLLVSGSIGGYRLYVLHTMPLDVRLAKQAWDAYEKKTYEGAIGHAGDCIAEFEGAAEREELKLEQENAPLPPTGRVADQEREVIWRRGPLNAVGTCFYVKGRSLEALGQKQGAIPAYKEATRYTYARCWDPRTKLFWSPAEAAIDRLRLLEK